MKSNVFVLLLHLLSMFKDVAGEDKIVGGTVVDPIDKYPFIVALLDHPNATQPICGGSLVDPIWVLSSMRCTAATHVAIGRYDFTNTSENYDIIEIDWTTRPEYDESDDAANDIDLMMIRLKTNSSYTPINLDDGANLDGRAVTTMGWGRTSFDGEVSAELLEVEVDMISCKKHYPDLITTNMLCATRDGKGACYGDGGGPLILEDEEILVGVLSYFACSDPKNADIYTKVSSQYEWIQNEIANGVRPNDYDDFFLSIFSDLLEYEGEGINLTFFEQVFLYIRILIGLFSLLFGQDLSDFLDDYDD